MLKKSSCTYVITYIVITCRNLRFIRMLEENFCVLFMLPRYRLTLRPFRQQIQMQLLASLFLSFYVITPLNAMCMNKI